MVKPTTLKDLLMDGHMSRFDAKRIAKAMFDGKTTVPGPEGYVITVADFEDLSDPTKQYIIKAILEFKVTNVLDARDQTKNDEPFE